jgi:uncharacterized protein
MDANQSLGTRSTVSRGQLAKPCGAREDYDEKTKEKWYKTALIEIYPTGVCGEQTMAEPTAATFGSQVVSVFLRDDAQGAGKAVEMKNLEVIERLYEAFLSRDMDTLLANMDEDVEWSISGPSEVPFVGACRGRAEVATVLQKSFAAVGEQEPEVEAVEAKGDCVTVHGFERGLHKPSGNRYETHWTHRFTLRDGKVVRFEEEFEPAPILEAMRAPGAR